MIGTDSNPYLSDAIRLIEAGAAICEVAAPVDGTCSCRLRDECPAPGKHPVGHAWLRGAVVRRDRGDFRIPSRVALAPTTSYGLVPMKGTGLLAIDVDAPNPRVVLPPTLTVTRPTAPAGRGHYWYVLAPEIDEVEVPRAFAGGEVRIAESGHVVGPGCRHVSGDTYESNGEDIAYATRDLIDALRAAPAVQRGYGGSVEAVLGSRHAWLVNQARKFAGWGWDLDRIADGLRELNETVCTPPLTEAEGEFARMAAWAHSKVAPDQPIRITRTRRSQERA